MEDLMIEVLSVAAVRGVANTVIKETADFLKNFYKEQKSLKNLSINNNDLVSSIAKLMQVKTLYTGSDKSVNLFDFFQQPKLSYEKEIYVIENIEELKVNENIVFVGTVGQGKSILMKYLAVRDLIDNNRIPVFIELKNIGKSRNIKSLIKDYLGSWIGFDDYNLDLILKSGKISLFLDAFDEIDLELTQETLHDIELLNQNYSNLKLTVSSRPQTIITKSYLFNNVYLQPYEQEEQEGLIRKLVNNEENIRILVDSIEKSSHEVKEVLTTPLMVVLFINQYNVGFSVPQHVTDFYKNIFDVVTFTHDRSKGIEKRKSFSSLNQDQLEKIFERFCFETFLKNKKVFDRQEFVDLLKISLEKNNIKDFNDSYNLISDYTRFACLILQDGNKYTFIHKSIQEFYVAKFIENLPENLAKNVIAKKFLYIHMGNENYLNFLKILKPYYYNKYYILETLEEYKKNMSLEFNSDNSNYQKFINSLRLVKGGGDRNTFCVGCFGTAFINLFDEELFQIVDILIQEEFVVEKMIRWGGRDDEDTLSRRNTKMKVFLSTDNRAKDTWALMCAKVVAWNDEVIRIENLVVEEDFNI
ncbi:MAG: hypothetical protein RR876_16340 [Acinetobacter sp.]|uniref:NACHT domain-containing protein n=2 Tax=Bacteria TaxID=2 RepID=UPI002FC9E742